MTAGPLHGIRVIDLSRVLAGPYATQRLADFGADVVKVERPGAGDETRAWGPPWQVDSRLSSYFTSVNRGKRSIAIDLASRQGAELVRLLASDADVLIHNLRSDSAARLGLDRETLAATNAGLVTCRINGFGDGRAPQARPGYDLIVQAESGLMAVTGPVGGEPFKVGVAVVDVLAGLEAAAAILAALVARGQTGEGEDIEVPLLDAAAAGLVNVAQGALATGEAPARHGNAHPSIVPYEPFRSSDGHVVIAVTNDPQWQALCRVLDRPDLAAEPDFAANPGRVANRVRLVGLLNGLFAKRTADEWVSLLSEAGIPCGRVFDVSEAFAAAAAAGDPLEVELAGGTQVVGAPQRFAGLRLTARGEPPRLGENTDDVLAEAGLTAGEIADLRSSGAVA